MWDYPTNILTLPILSSNILEPRCWTKAPAETLQQMIASPNYGVALLGIKATFIRFRLIEKY